MSAVLLTAVKKRKGRMRGKILRGMKKTGKNEGKKRISASFMTGAVALVFLVAGYQAALFLHKASVL